MQLKKLELQGFKSFAKKAVFEFNTPITAVVGPNGSGKSNIVESIRFVLGEQSMKSLRGKVGSDLIYKGSRHLSKANRATASITFDNRDRVFSLTSVDNKELSLDFDEITFTRTVYADGSNTYMLNGSEVRLKDIHEAIASVNIGSSGHHIISQGEADRLLNTSAKDRKGMLEDALGLKLYQYRIREAERKLSKTNDNLKESSLLRRELAPHLRFLKRQVDKIEKAKDMRRQLQELYVDYLKKEEVLLSAQSQALSAEKNGIESQMAVLDTQLDEHRQALQGGSGLPEEREIAQHEESLRILSSSKEELSRKLGRIEGMIEIAGRQLDAPRREKKPTQQDIQVQISVVEEFLKDIDADLSGLLRQDNIEKLREKLLTIKEQLLEFVSNIKDGKNTSADTMADIPDPRETIQAELDTLNQDKKNIQDEIQKIDTDEQALHEKISALRSKIHAEKSDIREREKVFFDISQQRNNLQSSLNMVIMREEMNIKERTQFDEELAEAGVLVGPEISAYTDVQLPVGINITRDTQEPIRKNIERLKIKLEDMGGGSGADVMQEYTETQERDAFLEKEITDLEGSVGALTSVINDLKDQLNQEFDIGIKKINTQFHEFFTRMFGGGKAGIRVIEIEKRKRKIKDEDGNEIEMEEDENTKKNIGVEIKVALPRKKVTALEMLSGGERSLTSIALLFALSQVNPPPFLVLDETDAALDEANSQRYGDMLESLSEYSQLMVVTHNRETMSRAHVLYGVTMSADGASQLLSVQLEEAAQFAK